MEETPLSSTFSRTQLNLWIGLCKGVYGLPRDIYELGFEPICIDHRFRNSAGESAHPDLIIESELKGHTLCLEFKSGGPDEGQLLRNSHILPADLVRQAWVRPSAATSHDVVVVIFTTNSALHQQALSNGGYRFPLLGTQPDGLALIANRFRLDELSSVFIPLLRIDWSVVPTSFVRIDGELGDWEIAETMGPAILARVISGQPRFGVAEICRDVSDMWSILGGPGQQSLRSRVRAVVARAVAGPFAPYLSLSGDTIRVTQGRLGDPARQAQALRALRTAQAQFIGDLRSSGRQLTLPLFPNQ